MPPLLRNTIWITLGATSALLLLLGLTPRDVGQAREYTEPVPAPPLNNQQADAWINSTPLSWEDLKGKVVLLDFWTFDCWNCYRSFPWLNATEQRFAKEGFIVIGIHTPEFEHEKLRSNVVEKTEEFEIEHPVMMDNDYAYWRAIGNRYWPTFYLVDKQGRIRAHYIGETHAGDPQAKEIEQQIAKLLTEE